MRLAVLQENMPILAGRHLLRSVDRNVPYRAADLFVHEHPRRELGQQGDSEQAAEFCDKANLPGVRELPRKHLLCLGRAEHNRGVDNHLANATGPTCVPLAYWVPCRRASLRQAYSCSNQSREECL